MKVYNSRIWKMETTWNIFRLCNTSTILCITCFQLRVQEPESSDPFHEWILTEQLRSLVVICDSHSHSFVRVRLFTTKTLWFCFFFCCCGRRRGTPTTYYHHVVFKAFFLLLLKPLFHTYILGHINFGLFACPQLGPCSSFDKKDS